MAGFEATEWINRPPPEVFNFLADATNAPKVVPSVVRVEKLTEGPVGVGTRYRETRLMTKKEAQAELEVSGYESPGHFAMHNVTNGIETTYDYRLSAERDGTRVNLAAEVRAGGLKKAMVPVVVSILKKEDGDHLQRLKDAMEKG